MNNRQIEIFKNLLSYAERNTCLHEETHRGGAIWEICDLCGKKWADDRGGKPENAHEWPKEIEEAQNLLIDLNKNTTPANHKHEIDFLNQTYQPETIAIPTLEIENIVDALEAGLEHTQTVLAEHDASLGRTTRQNKSWAEQLEKDIEFFKTRIKLLKQKLVGATTHYP